MKKYLFLLLLIVLSSCTSNVLDKELNTTGDNLGYFPAPPDDKVPIVPDPTRVGSLPVCSTSYTLSRYLPKDTRDPEVGDGIIYYPKGITCSMVKDGKWPVVVFIHADGPTVKTQYDEYLSHIASWGYVVLAYHRNQIGANDGSKAVTLFKEHLSYLYNQSIVKNNVTADISLIGHSAGGGTVRQVIKLPEIDALNLKSVILMAPAKGVESYDMSPYVKNLLVFGIASDGDDNVNGSDKPADEVMKTGIIDYDMFAHQQGGNKDLIFVRDGEVITPGHYFQNEDFTKAYTVGFLQLTVKGLQDYSLYFEGQKIPTGIAPERRFKNSHRDWNDKLVQDFEQESVPNQQQNGVLSEVNTCYLYDQNSPHNTKSLYVTWNSNNTIANLEYTIHPDMGVNGSKYVAFDVSQLYDMSSQDNLNFKVYLIDNVNPNVKRYVDVKDFGALLKPFGIVVPVVKTVMQSFIIPTSKFAGVDINNLSKVGFEFSDPNFKTGTMVLDNVRFSD